MITLNPHSLFDIGSTHGLSAQEIADQSHLLPSYLSNIERKKQGFYTVIDDGVMLRRIQDFASGLKGKFEDIVVLGIGGSALGTICLQQGLRHLFRHRKDNSSPELHVLDNIDPMLLKEVEDILALEKTLFIVVTKSGSTPETLAQYFYFRNLCERAELNIQDHFVFITDPHVGLLRSIANKENIPVFEVPQNVGGRFSVLTSVGLLPVALLGDIDVSKLIAGAKKMRALFLSQHPAQNLPFQLAAIQYLLWEKGKTINVMIPYAQKLIRFADWYRQLLAESIGKKLNTRGEEVYVGITPVNALGVTDQHSQSQLYNEGPNDKLHMFLQVKDFGFELPLPSFPQEEKSLQYLEGISFNKLIATEMEGTIQSLNENHRPNLTFEIGRIDEENFGELFMLFEAATAFLGEFFEIDAFGQPGVELSKILTRRLLEGAVLRR